MPRGIWIVLFAALVVITLWSPWGPWGSAPSTTTAGDDALRSEETGMVPEPQSNPYMMPTDRLVSVAGTTIRLRDQGPKDAPVLVMLHGYTFSLESFDIWADQLSAEYRVIRYDLLGHGLSGPDPEKRYAPLERAAFLGDVLDHLEIQDAHIAGNSLGGLVAWRFASLHPDRVKSLMLVAPAAFSFNGVTDEPAPVPPGLAFFLRTAPLAGVQASLRMCFADDGFITTDRVALAHHMMSQPGNGEAFVEHLEEFTLPDPTAVLGAITAPTLILWGTDDELIPVDHAERVEQAIPGSELILLPDIGHLPQEEDGAGTAEMAATFLAAATE